MCSYEGFLFDAALSGLQMVSVIFLYCFGVLCPVRPLLPHHYLSYLAVIHVIHLFLLTRKSTENNVLVTPKSPSNVLFSILPCNTSSFLSKFLFITFGHDNQTVPWLSLPRTVDWVAQHLSVSGWAEDFDLSSNKYTTRQTLCSFVIFCEFNF